jgi:uncharacterized membrane protein
MRPSLQHLDLALATAIALLMVATSLLLPGLSSPLRVAMGMLLLLVLPGYCLMVALFPHRGDIGSLERLAVSFGLSIVVVPIAGLVLANTPWGIRFDSVALALAAFVVVAALIALARRVRLTPDIRFTPQTDPTFLRSFSFAGLGVGVMIALAVGLQLNNTFTALYLLGEEGQLEAFPNHLQAGEPFVLTVAVENREWRPQRYRLEASTDPASIVTVELPRIRVGDVWSEDLELVAPAEPGRHQITVDLYRGRGRTPYRQVHLDLTVLAVVGSEAP